MTRIGGEGRGKQISKQNSDKGDWNLFPCSRWPVKESGEKGRAGEEGTDWPTGATPWLSQGEQPAGQQVLSQQRKLQGVSFPPLQLWTSVRRLISLQLQVKIIKTDWLLKYLLLPFQKEAIPFISSVCFPLRRSAAPFSSFWTQQKCISPSASGGWSRLPCALPTSLEHWDSCPEAV